MLLILSLICVSLSQKVEVGGRCPEVPVIADFDAERYKGRWYEQHRYPNEFTDPESKCNTAFYAILDETTISVNNSEMVPDTDSINPTDEEVKYRLVWASGNGTQVFVSWNIVIFEYHHHKSATIFYR